MAYTFLHPSYYCTVLTFFLSLTSDASTMTFLLPLPPPPPPIICYYRSFCILFFSSDGNVQKGARPWQAKEAPHSVFLFSDRFPCKDERETYWKGKTFNGDLRWRVEQVNRGPEETLPWSCRCGIQEISGGYGGMEEKGKPCGSLFSLHCCVYLSLFSFLTSLLYFFLLIPFPPSSCPIAVFLVSFNPFSFITVYSWSLFSFLPSLLFSESLFFLSFLAAYPWYLFSVLLSLFIDVPCSRT